MQQGLPGCSSLRTGPRRCAPPGAYARRVPSNTPRQTRMPPGGNTRHEIAGKGMAALRINGRERFEPPIQFGHNPRRSNNTGNFQAEKSCPARPEIIISRTPSAVILSTARAIKGWPANSTHALSRPMRLDSPPARMTALCCFSIHPDQNPVGNNPAPQPRPPAQPFLRARTERGIHPMTRTALLHAFKPHALNFKSFPDERGQICPANKGIAPRRLRLGIRQMQLLTQRLQHLHREKCDLTLI